ncbi:MAG: NAD(P)H-dependent oxidoreductase subunit E [Candidatus Sphingomonas colombiensis]|nr:NAD(P)H-dependent oxidoreductase subunit E [Sphingomonas sp.]WEK43812.1 MAG: NAD(P)H-dependent oxidoreductase subunit E [Sphingomonas sp.]
MTRTNTARQESPSARYAEAIARFLRDRAPRRDALLPLLHALQVEFGYIDGAMVVPVAAALNLSRADAHGVVTFYHDFRTAPAGTHIIRLCRAESCQARGGAAIERHATERLGLNMGETSADGRVTIEPIYCLGLCATGPNALVDGRPVSRLDAAKIDRIAAELLA